MCVFTILSLLLYLSIPASAHFKLLFPPSRPFDEDTLPQFPCGGQNSVSPNRTRISPSGFPLRLLMGHDEAAVEVLLGLGNNVGSNFNITLVKTFREEGLGNFCLDTIKVDGVDGLSKSLFDGQNATLQVVTNGDGEPAGGLYNCADVTFVAANPATPSAGSCKNNTGIKSAPLTTNLHANESNADGSPQQGASGRHSSASSSASSTATMTGSSSATAASASSTGAAPTMATAGWGLVGAAVFGAVAVL